MDLQCICKLWQLDLSMVTHCLLQNSMFGTLQGLPGRPCSMYDIYDFRNSDSCILSANEKLRWFSIEYKCPSTDLFFISFATSQGEIPIAQKDLHNCGATAVGTGIPVLPRYPPRLQAMVSHQMAQRQYETKVERLTVVLAEYLQCTRVDIVHDFVSSADICWPGEGVL